MTQTTKTILISAIVGLCAAFIGVKAFAPNSVVSITQEESVYERVMRTGKIRCGYALWPPYMSIKDTETDEVVGFAPDIAELIGEKLGLEIEWTEETGWGNFIESLQNDRFDVFCSAVWEKAGRGKYISFTRPFAYSPVFLYVREGDNRFDNDFSLLNSPGIKISTMDGEMSALIAEEYFPKAQTVSIPQLADISQMLMNVSTGKADAVFNEPGFLNDFVKKNPNSLRKASDKPFHVFANTFAVKIGEDKMVSMLNTAFTELVNQGHIQRILEKYESRKDVFLPVSQPYEVPK